MIWTDPAAVPVARRDTEGCQLASWGEPADLGRCRRGALQQFVGIFVDLSAVHPPRRPPQDEREGNFAVRVEHRGRDGSELVEIGAVERVRVVALRGGLDEFPERAGREV